jgi:hypothetical protein
MNNARLVGTKPAEMEKSAQGMAIAQLRQRVVPVNTNLISVWARGERRQARHAVLDCLSLDWRCRLRPQRLIQRLRATGFRPATAFGHRELMAALAEDGTPGVRPFPSRRKRKTHGWTSLSKVVLITGGASGIGLASAEACAREGARVVITDINVAEGSAQAGRLAGEGLEVSFVPHDAINAEVFLGSREAVRVMKGRGGSIINLSSIEGIIGEPLLPAYNASKGAVRILSKSTALQGAQPGYGIRVNSIHPGYVGTPLNRARSRTASCSLPRTSRAT